ncbi:DUF368 domain-containing protein [Endozoicomonas numazuensis]|uniref:Membrane protein n=1 Tax=Endozoicomonas numazuensis TaxID=1137799 RepID=A0A081NH62_9GAMM|nr:DUF368 domain-containing protein [Endozoicomonas numazuensis]KEQ17785.1 membrane protein [Endozoicomonas numazuensis]
MSKMKEGLGFLLRGMAMGAADVVPGVSGGTIAFITGIYDRLLNALKSINPALLMRLKSEGVAACWKHIDGTFLVLLFGGILLSILSFAHLITFLLDNYPELIWSFFFGLILISGVHMLKQIKHWSVTSVILLVLGCGFSYFIGTLTPTALTPSYLMLFFAGCIAISAMILPGISGSFILLLMGLYPAVLAAVKGLDVLVLSVFGSGCIVGLLTFSHVLSWLLKHHRDLALSLLTGLMLGALSKVWPWKETLETRINSSGQEVPFLERNISPWAYESLSGQSAYLLPSIALMLSAIVLVVLLEKFGSRLTEN